MSPPRQYSRATPEIDRDDRRRVHAGVRHDRAQHHLRVGPGRAVRVVTVAAVRVQVPERPGRVVGRHPADNRPRPGCCESKPAASSARRSGPTAGAVSWMAEKPSTRPTSPRWHTPQSFCDGTSCGVPPTFWAPSGARSASVCVGVPDEGAHPVVVRTGAVSFDEAGLQQDAVQRELFPELGADREHPVIHVAGVDLRPRRQTESSGAWWRRRTRACTSVRTPSRTGRPRG